MVVTLMECCFVLQNVDELVLWHSGCCCCFCLLWLCLVFPWWWGLVHQRCVCRGEEHRWEAAQRVSLSLTAPLQQATPISTEERSRYTVAPPTQTLWSTHPDAVSPRQNTTTCFSHKIFFFSWYIFCCCILWLNLLYFLLLNCFKPTWTQREP